LWSLNERERQENIAVLSGSDLDQMTQRLRAISRDGGSIEAAQVKLIGLDEIREAAGPRWPRMRERVRTGSMSILHQHCGPDDVVIPAGDGFLIMLAEGRPGDSQRRCQDMKDALVKFYLGEDALQALRPDVKKHALSKDGLTELIASSMRGPVVARGHKDEIALAPVLVTHEQRMSAMIAGPAHRSEGQARRLCHNPDFLLDGHHHERKDYLELDLAVVDAALGRLSKWKQMGHTGVVGVTVHASTMQSRRAREAYLAWLAELDPEQRRMLFVSIAEIERGTPLISISDWCCSLRSLVGRVWLDFHYSDHAIGSVGATGAWAAGFSLPAFAVAQRGPRAERLRQQIGFWSKTLRSQGMRLVVHGFQDAAFLEEGRSMGVDLLTSDAHWPFSDIDEGVQH
jgi:hypothetical protein